MVRISQLLIILFSSSLYLSTVNVTCEEGIKQFGTKYKCANYFNSKLGEGSSGVAYLIEETQTKLKRVLKISNVVTRPVPNSAAYVIHNELNGLPYIVTRFDFHFNNMYIFEVLEYAVKGDLANYTKSINRKDERKILELFLKIVEGVAAIHSKNIIHADIKPENIIVKENDEPMIIDFDISIHKGDQVSPRGTLLYMAPEIYTALGSRITQFTDKADIWSLGATLYYMLYLDYPFKIGQYHQQLIRNQSILKIRQGTSYEVINILLMMFKEDPNDRLSAEQLGKRIKEILGRGNWKYLDKNHDITIDTEDIYLVDLKEMDVKVENMYKQAAILERLAKTKNPVILIDTLHPTKTVQFDWFSFGVYFSLFAISGLIFLYVISEKRG